MLTKTEIGAKLSHQCFKIQTENGLILCLKNTKPQQRILAGILNNYCFFKCIHTDAFILIHIEYQEKYAKFY